MEILLDTLKWSIIAGILALVLALLKPAFEKRYSARWRYWLWLVLAVLALLAPVQWEKLLPDAPAVHTPLIIDIPEMELQVIQGEGILVALRPAYSAPLEVKRAFRLDEILPAVWLAGTGVFTLYALAGTWLFRHKVQRWSRNPKESTLRLYESVQRDMGLKKAPPLRVSSAASSPMLAGVLRPWLILPGETWGERELTFILRHELTHYRRHDLWYKLVLLAANALHWFNPLMYLLVREANADMELTCDGVVVSGESQEARRAYSETLLAAVRRKKGFGTSLSTHFYGGKEIMKERFRNILGKQGQKWGAAVLVLALLATVICAGAFGLRQAETLDTPLEESGAVPDEVQAYIDSQIAHLEESGAAVIDQRSKLTIVDTYSWDFYDSEMQVWKLDYALKLERPEEYTPAGSQELDAGGWLSGIDGLGEPHFIYSVYRGEEEPVINLEEIAYSNVEWEYRYTWEEYACCHTLFGLELSPIPFGGWPEPSAEFLLSMHDGHETWALDWEDVALSYLAAQGEDPSMEALSATCVFEVKEGYAHDEARLVGFLTASGRTGSMLLTHVNGTGTADEQPMDVGFWQVTGILWQDEAEVKRAAAFMREFLDYEKAGDADSVIAMEHFENNWESGLKHDTIENSEPSIQSYEILSAEKVNDFLYAFYIEAETVYDTEPMTFYNFVMIMDDGYHTACNIANIPAEISGGADLSRFEVDDPNALGRPDEDEYGNLLEA